MSLMATGWQTRRYHSTFCLAQSVAVPFSHIGMLVHQVVVLRSFRSKLCEALAEVHSTTSALHLRVTKHEDADSHAGQSSSAGEGSHTEHLFQQACQAIVQTCNSCSKVSLIWHSWTLLASLLYDVMMSGQMKSLGHCQQGIITV